MLRALSVRTDRVRCGLETRIYHRYPRHSRSRVRWLWDTWGRETKPFLGYAVLLLSERLGYYSPVAITPAAYSYVLLNMQDLVAPMEDDSPNACWSPDRGVLDGNLVLVASGGFFQSLFTGLPLRGLLGNFQASGMVSSRKRKKHEGIKSAGAVGPQLRRLLSGLSPAALSAAR